MFGFGDKNTFLGIDIGTSAVKVVELKTGGGKPTLTNYAWVELESVFGDQKMVSANSFENVLTLCLKKIIQEGKIKGKMSYASIPAFGGLITLIEFPEMSREDLDQAIKFEAHKYIPTSLDSVVFSWDIVGGGGSHKLLDRSAKKNPEEKEEQSAVPSGNSKMQVLLVAASKNKVVKYENIIKEAGLDLRGIEIESFSMVRSLVGNDPGNFVIVDIGSRVCNIILVEKGIVKVNRNLDAGGKDITRTIAKSMNIDDSRAEKLKLSDDFFKEQSSITFPTLDLISSEVLRVINAYYKEEGRTKIDSVILSGGTANLKGIAEYFSNSLNIKTIIGNPFSRISYDKRLEEVVDKMKTQFSVSIGLALRGDKK